MFLSKQLIFGILLILGFMVTVSLAQTTGDPISDLFAQLGVNIGVVSGIILVTGVIKALLPAENKLLKFIVLLPMLLAFLYALFLGGYVELSQKLYMAFLFAAAAGYLFDIGKKAVEAVKK